LKFGPRTKLRGLPEKRTGLKTLFAFAIAAFRSVRLAAAEREGHNAIALFARIID
jgi:hypothetical protein